MKIRQTILSLSIAAMIAANASAVTNSTYPLVTYQVLTNFFNAYLSNGFGSNAVIISSGLLAVTNGAGVITISTNGAVLPYTKGGSQTNSSNGFKINAAGMMIVSNSSYFGGNNPTNFQVATNLPTPNYAGQLLMTYSEAVGGIFGGQLFIAGNDLSWRRAIQMGPIVIMQNELIIDGHPAVDNPLNVRAGPFTGVDNLIVMQNMDSNHFDAMCWRDPTGERGAIGFGNSAVPFYKGINYLEDNSGENGFYFVGQANIMGGLEKTTGDFVWYNGAATSSNNPFGGLTNIFRIQRSTGKLIGDGSGLTGIVAVTTNGTARNLSAAYFGDINNNAIASTAGFPAATFAGQMLMTYSPAIGGESAGQLFFAGNDLSWRRQMQFGHTAILETNAGVGEGLLVKTANIGQVATLQSIDANEPSSLVFADSTNSTAFGIGYGNISNSIYRGVGFIDSPNTNHGVYFTAGGNLMGGLHATNGNFVWYTGTSISSNNPYLGLTESFSIDRSTGDVRVKSGTLIVSNVMTALAIDVGLTARVGTNLAFLNAKTNLPVTTNAPKYYITITNNGLAGSIPVYQ